MFAPLEPVASANVDVPCDIDASARAFFLELVWEVSHRDENHGAETDSQRGADVEVLRAGSRVDAAANRAAGGDASTAWDFSSKVGGYRGDPHIDPERSPPDGPARAGGGGSQGCQRQRRSCPPPSPPNR